MNLASLTIHGARERLRKREISAVELAEAVFQRIADIDDKVHAYITLCRDSCHRPGAPSRRRFSRRAKGLDRSPASRSQ